MRPNVKFDGWEDWFYKHEEELVNGTYVVPSQKLKFKQALPDSLFSSLFSSYFPQAPTHQCN